MSFHSNRKHLSSQEKHKLRENEKFERNYRNWQLAKYETRQGDNSLYRERIVLQRSLISAQDELTALKREEALQEIAEKRKAEKASRQARQEALVNVCRQSLDNDRKSLRARSRYDPRAQNENPSTTPSTETPSPIKSLITEQLKAQTKSESSSPFVRHALSPFVDEDDEDEKTDQSALTRKLSESLPWYHAQLYHLYGDKADYFLHPKIEPKPQKQLHPKLRNPEGGGAEELWAGLRNESMTRLKRYDRYVPAELKSAFSAFVRQNLSKNIALVQRSFCSEEDVPEMSKLLDKTSLNKARAFRHKLQLMHRSSLTNADRTKVLTYNNPLPDLNNLEGQDSIARYLPSWLENDEEFENEYEREEIQLNDDLKETLENKNVVDLDLMEVKPKYVEYPRLKFLTPCPPKSNRSFSVKFEENDKPSSAMIPVPIERKLGEEFKVQTLHDTGRAKEENPKSTDQKKDPRFITKWEPLSMNALVEYTKKIPTTKRGEFQYGQTTMWHTTLKT